MSRIAVVGAGALGISSAYALAQAGHNVTVFDRGQIAGETTGFAAGILSTALLTAEDRALTKWTMDGLDALPEDPMPGADVGPMLHRSGGHLLVGDGPARRLVAEMANGVRALGIDCTERTPDGWGQEMSARGLPAEIDDLAAVLTIPSDAWALSTSTTERVARHAKTAGVRLRLNHDVALTHDGADGGRITGVRVRARPGGADSSGPWTDLAMDAVVVAAGAWSRALVEAVDLRLPTQAFRTHAAVLRTPHARAAPIVHDDAGGYYMRPESDMHVLVGDGTRTEAIDPNSIDHEAEASFIEDIAARVPRRFPSLADAGLQNAWRGVLTAVPDRRPLVGAHPDAAGLFLCTGGNGFGFMRSLALGACLAATVDSRGAPTGLPTGVLEWMDPARFWPDPPAAFVAQEGFSLHGAV